MNKWHKLSLFLVCWVVAVVALSARSLSSEREPTYQGRSFTDWLDEYYSDSRERTEDDTPKTEAYFAIRAIGTNALPTLLRWVEQEPSPWGEQLRLLVGKLPAPVAKLGFLRNLSLRVRRPYFWHQAFLILGPDANPDVPQLTRLMREPAAKDKGFSAALALAYIGPAGLAPLQAAAADPGARCRLNAISALGEMGTNALPAIPLLMQCLTNANLDVARSATYALCKLRLQPELVLPALANCLQSPDPNTRIEAASWLAEVEAYRPKARHVLFDARKDAAKEVRRLAEAVIIDTMPEEIIAVPPP